METPAWEVGPGFLESLWRYKWFVAAAVLVSALAAYAFAVKTQPPLYESRARIVLSDPRNVGELQDVSMSGTDMSRHVRNQAQIVSSEPVIARTVELIDERLPASAVGGLVRGEPAQDVDIMTVVALDSSPEDANELANAAARAYEDVVGEQVLARAERILGELGETRAELDRELTDVEEALRLDPDDPVLGAEQRAVREQLIAVGDRIRAIRAESVLFGSGVALREQATWPGPPVQPRPKRAAAVGGMFGFLLAGAAAWWLNGHKKDARTFAAQALDAPLLGEIPLFRRVKAEGPVPVISAPESSAAEAYRFLVTSLQAALRQQETPATCVLFTSARAGEGKTVTALNVAAATEGLDSGGVILVDADAHVRGLTKLSNWRLSHTLQEISEHPAASLESARRWKLSEDIRLTLVGVETRDSAQDLTGFFRSRACHRAMEALRYRAGLVIVDAPPALAVANVSEIARHVDAVVVVLLPDTTENALREVRRRFETADVPILGYVINRSTLKASPYVYGYPYGKHAPHSDELVRGGRPDNGASARPQPRSAKRHRLPRRSEPAKTPGSPRGDPPPLGP